jgi:hypothetical protein
MIIPTEVDMDQHTLILIGAWGGAGLGGLGGLVGTYFSIRNTNGPRERAFVVRSAVLCWLALTGFVTAVILIPKPYDLLLWLPYMAALPYAARAWNRRQRQIRREESGASARS